MSGRTIISCYVKGAGFERKANKGKRTGLVNEKLTVNFTATIVLYTAEMRGRKIRRKGKKLWKAV